MFVAHITKGDLLVVHTRLYIELRIEQHVNGFASKPHYISLSIVEQGTSIFSILVLLVLFFTNNILAIYNA